MAFGFRWKPAFIAYSQWPKLSNAILYACKNQYYAADQNMTKSNKNRNFKFPVWKGVRKVRRVNMTRIHYMHT